ncbi:MAG TPA: cholesterol oxidase substrate-binding domain-containing protein [Actinocrinis sp.]
MLPSESDGAAPGRAGPTRRAFLRAAALSGAAAATVGWEPAFRIPLDATRAATGAPFPAGIPVYQQAYSNWCGQITADDVWTCAPDSAAQVVAAVNWAYQQGWQVRPAGMRHGWAPLTLTSGESAEVLLIDTTQYLTAVQIDDGPPASVTAQAGITMEALLTSLETAGYGVTACPAPGDVTLGGVLAIDGHGTAVPAAGETPVPGTTYGSISNLVISLTAVVWDATQGAYATRTFQRDDPQIQALLVNLGRTLVVEATLRVGQNQRLRCVSRVDLTTDTLFAPPATAGDQSLAALVEQTGRVETIWFPYTPAPWLKVWSIAPEMPPTSRETTMPYNYPFADAVLQPESDLVNEIMSGNTAVTPEFTNLAYTTTAAGLTATGSADLWGWSKNTQLYVRPTTLRVTANGYAVLTTRDRIQTLVSEFYQWLTAALQRYADAGSYPVNGPWEVRVTGLDQAADSGAPGALEAQLSAIRPRPDLPFDTVVWFDVLTLPGTLDSETFYAELEQWILATYNDGTDAVLRPEWSKGWAYDGTAPWSDATVIGSVIPAAYRAGQQPGDDWDTALATLDALDPNRIFTNPFLDQLTP